MTMRQRSEPAERLLVAVETAAGSELFEVDERLQVEQVRQCCDRQISTARLAVRLDDDFDTEAVRQHYHPDRRLIIMTEHPDAAKRAILFDGYLPVQASRWNGVIERDQESYQIEAEHVYERLCRAPRAWVYGRHVRNGPIEDGLLSHRAAFEDQAVQMTALPCVFNHQGQGNMASIPLVVRTDDEQTLPVHLFTADSDGERWSYAAIIRYLVWFHLLKEGPVRAGNVYEVTSAVINGTDAGGPPAMALKQSPASLSCEGMNLVEALGVVCRSAGLHVSVDTWNDNGRPVTALRLFSPRGGDLKRLYLVRGGRDEAGRERYPVAGRRVTEILQDNNTHRGQVRWDHRRIVNQPIVLGDVRRYELTVPLVPGWLPTAGLDDVPAELRAVAKAEALTPKMVQALGDQAAERGWYRRYVTDGSDFAGNADVGRRWVLNEDGACTADLFNRNEPFHNYKPFDFTTVLDAAIFHDGHWMRRPRPLQPALSVRADGVSFGVWLEISFDGGVNWQAVPDGYQVLTDRAGIRFDLKNLTEIVLPGMEPEDQNLWYALVDQILRVRVTGVIQGDARLSAVGSAGRFHSPASQVNTTVIHRPQTFGYAVRDRGNSVLAAIGSDGSAVRDDSAAIEQAARRLGESGQDRRIQMAPAIPWIELGYQPGDRISEIRGRHLQLATTAGSELHYPVVIERRFMLVDGRYETALTLGSVELTGKEV